MILQKLQNVSLEYDCINQQEDIKINGSKHG